jgi:hypothetical protein
MAKNRGKEWIEPLQFCPLTGQPRVTERSRFATAATTPTTYPGRCTPPRSVERNSVIIIESLLMFDCHLLTFPQTPRNMKIDHTDTDRERIVSCVTVPAGKSRILRGASAYRRSFFDRIDRNFHVYIYRIGRIGPLRTRPIRTLGTPPSTARGTPGRACCLVRHHHGTRHLGGWAGGSHGCEWVHRITRGQESGRARL